MPKYFLLSYSTINWRFVSPSRFWRWRPLLVALPSAAASRWSIKDSINSKPYCNRPRQESAIFTQGHFWGMPDLLTALATFIFVLEYVWTLRIGDAQPQPLYLTHLHRFVDLFSIRPLDLWRKNYCVELRHIQHHAAVHIVMVNWVILANRTALHMAYKGGSPVPVSELCQVQAVFCLSLACFTVAIKADPPIKFQHSPAMLTCAAFGGLAQASPGAPWRPVPHGDPAGASAVVITGG